MTASAPAAIPLVGLRAQYASIKADIDAAIARVLESQRFIGGPEVEAFEAEWAAFCGARFCVGVSSGTAALELALEAVSVGPGDEVIVPAMTFTATAGAVFRLRARPVFVDIEPGAWTMDMSAVQRARNKRTKAIIPVNLYGQPANLEAVEQAASGLAIILDSAQSHGTSVGGGPTLDFAHAECFSFYPGKILGAYGDAGAVVTNGPGIARNIRMLADHGRLFDELGTGRASKYEHVLVGTSARLDALQAAILRAKLPCLRRWIERRREIAGRYLAGLAGLPFLRLPVESGRPARAHVWHLFVVCHPQRDRLREHLATLGIATGIHYPTPLHLQPCYADLGYRRGDFPVSERLADECLSLPIYPEMDDEQIERVIDGVRRFYER